MKNKYLTVFYFFIMFLIFGCRPNFQNIKLIELSYSKSRYFKTFCINDTCYNANFVDLDIFMLNNEINKKYENINDGSWYSFLLNQYEKNSFLKMKYNEFSDSSYYYRCFTFKGEYWVIDSSDRSYNAFMDIANFSRNEIVILKVDTTSIATCNMPTEIHERIVSKLLK